MLDLNRGNATVEQLKNVQAQIDKLRDLPAVREQASAAEAAETARRAILIDSLTDLEVEHDARLGAFDADLKKAGEAVEAALAAHRERVNQKNELETAKGSADSQHRRKQSQLQNELNGLGEVEVEQLLETLARETLNCVNNSEARMREERTYQHERLVVLRRSTTPSLDAHIEKLSSLTREAQGLRRAKLPVSKIKERASEIREKAMPGTGVYFNRHGSMPQTAEEACRNGDSVDLSYSGGRSRVEFENGPRFAWQR